MDNLVISARKFLFDLLALLFLTVTWIGVYFGLPVTIRGFFTCDQKLTYTYHTSTIPAWLNFLIAITVPCLVMFSIRLYRSFRVGVSLNPPKTYTIDFMSRTFNISSIWYGFYYELFAFAFGLIAECLLADVLKHTIGELRPYFLHACTPQFDNKSSTEQCPYVSIYQCSNNNNLSHHAISEMRKSFPSNHSGSIFFGMVFTCVVLYVDWIWTNTRSFSYLLMIACIAFASYVAVTRVLDHKHFPHDVLAGAILGSVMGSSSAFMSANSIRD
ncbi:hypothetical protein ACOME3_005782 [Neoechinorhynchus agilis]